MPRVPGTMRAKRSATDMTRYFEYGEEEISYLKAKDRRLAAAIDACGHVNREMEEGDLFSGIVHHIIGRVRVRSRKSRARRWRCHARGNLRRERRTAAVVRHDLQEGRLH